ncbi:MAG: hypothetical protein A2Y77_15040 [Planctomycetes bacterium RBG_13_62_9]|nr:MAG: hypothetical protein A2Y77_15040 [Planctomycetes bacterium RBG_13_62_9]
MGRRLIHLIVVVALGLCATSWGQVKDFDIPMVSPAPSIDGEVDDVWATVSKQHMEIDIGEGPRSDAKDCSGYFQALYDSDYLYVLIDINDSELKQDTALADGWQDDSAEFYFDGNNSKGAQGAIEPDDFQYRFDWNVNEPDSYFYEYFHRPQSMEGVEYMMVGTQTGYRFEIRFPWTTLMGAAGVPTGKLIGIDCFINDDDDGGGSREHQVAWHATAGTGWNTPQMWGTALMIAPFKASAPNPRNGAPDVTVPLFRWTAGKTATFHNVYMGKTPDLGPADLVGPKSFLAMFYYAAGLEPGVTYYWRVDEIEKDGVTIHAGDVWSFVAQPKTAYQPDPANGMNTASPAPALNWLGGSGGVVAHQLYLSDNLDAVSQGKADADKGKLTDPTFTPGALQEGTTYYWRVDEISATGAVVAGEVWNFTTVVPVDDFESYTDDEGSRIYETWIDGWTNNNGSTVGYVTAPFAEQTVVHGGLQSMPLDYNNVNTPFYSEAEQTFATAQDWTAGGTDTLVLYLRGRSANKPAPVYVVVKDASNRTGVVVHSDAAVARALKWVEWKIPLSEFAASGVKLTSVKKIAIGVGDTAATAAGGTGLIYVDDIGLAKPAPAAQ